MPPEKKQKYLQVRVNDQEYDRIQELADAYGRDVSTFIRDVMDWMYASRPSIRITVHPKADALAPNVGLLTSLNLN